jgi:hypothetical protein
MRVKDIAGGTALIAAACFYAARAQGWGIALGIPLIALAWIWRRG